MIYSQLSTQTNSSNFQHLRQPDFCSLGKIQACLLDLIQLLGLQGEFSHVFFFVC